MYTRHINEKEIKTKHYNQKTEDYGKRNNFIYMYGVWTPVQGDGHRVSLHRSFHPSKMSEMPGHTDTSRQPFRKIGEQKV